MDKSDPSYKGQSGYNAAMLSIYDVWVLKFMTKAVWKVPVAQGVDRYRQHMGHRHLDVGPGTGYFIEKPDPPRDTEITLLDPNQTVLRHVAKRLEERHPITVEADVMKPLPVDGPFDSAALSFVLHCLRGPEGNKAVAVRNIADVLSPEGVLFGGTVLGLQGNHTKPARAFLRAANKQGGFDNVDDTAEGLRRILEMSFSAVDVDVVGSAALFTAARPRSRPSGEAKRPMDATGPVTLTRPLSDHDRIVTTHGQTAQRLTECRWPSRVETAGAHPLRCEDTELSHCASRWVTVT
jgi:ubiquinone/menaquinone biosynthesis C-methylase UbiE